MDTKPGFLGECLSSTGEWFFGSSSRTMAGSCSICYGPLILNQRCVDVSWAPMLSIWMFCSWLADGWSEALQWPHPFPTSQSLVQEKASKRDCVYTRSSNLLKLVSHYFGDPLYYHIHIHVKIKKKNKCFRLTSLERSVSTQTPRNGFRRLRWFSGDPGHQSSNVQLHQSVCENYKTLEPGIKENPWGSDLSAQLTIAYYSYVWFRNHQKPEMPRILVGWITFTNHNIRFAMVVPWAPLSLQALLRNHVSVVWPTASSPRAEKTQPMGMSLCIRISLCIDLHTHRCIFHWFIHVYTHTYIYIYTYIWLHIRIYIYVCICVCVRVGTAHACISLYIWLYMHMHLATTHEESWRFLKLSRTSSRWRDRSPSWDSKTPCQDMPRPSRRHRNRNDKIVPYSVAHPIPNTPLGECLFFGLPH